MNCGPPGIWRRVLYLVTNISEVVIVPAFRVDLPILQTQGIGFFEVAILHATLIHRTTIEMQTTTKTSNLTKECHISYLYLSMV